MDIESCLVSFVEGQLKCKIPKKGAATEQEEGVCNIVQQFKDYERIYRIIQVEFTGTLPALKRPARQHIRNVYNESMRFLRMAQIGLFQLAPQVYL